MHTLPTQPLHTDDRGTVRFVPNRLVQVLFEKAKFSNFGLNELTVLCNDDSYTEEWMQFAQLIGYSVSGFSTLSYVSDQKYNEVMIQMDSYEKELDVDPKDAIIKSQALVIESLQNTISQFKSKIGEINSLLD